MLKYVRLTVFALYVAVMCSMAAATVIEKFKGSDFVAGNVYGAWWFSALWAVLAVAAVAWIWHHRKAMNAPVVLLHGALLVVLAGACITHATRWQGVTTIRKGGQTSTVVTIQGRQKGNELRLPFAIKLEGFDVATHEGTDAARDYISHVAITSASGTEHIVITMNHPARTNGMTVMQMGFDADRQGSTLAVSCDPWGTPVTYTGYALLFVAMLWMLAGRGSTFRRLLHSRLLRECAFMALLAMAVTQAARGAGNTVPPSLPAATAHEMGKLLVLHNGRICPLQTLATDFTRKVYGASTYKGLSAEQVMTGWLFWDDRWAAEPFIKTGRTISATLMIDRHNALNRFFSESMGGYVLGPYVSEYYGGERDAFHSDVAAVDERVQLVMQMRRGELMRLFPLTHDGAVHWYAPTDNLPATTPALHAAFVRNALGLMRAEARSGHAAAVDTVVTKLSRLQLRDGGRSLPTETQVKAELAYNAVPFNTVLFAVNLTMGLVMLVAGLVRTGRARKPADRQRGGVARIVPRVVMALSFAALTACCALRWIISGTVPMANGFETMLFVAWVVMLVSLVCCMRVPVVLTFGFLMSGFFLLVSHISQMDPQITHVMPVLNSPLLSIHVSVIITAFALLSITFVCGLTALMARARMGAGNDGTKRLLESYAVLSRLFLYPAVAMLTIGIFVGAVWAERSWGEYWGWDPKETWALITLMVYAVPLHTTSVSALRRPLAYHVFMTAAFLTIIMTYFGVNYFLGGMHSYA